MAKGVNTSQNLADAMCGPFELIEHWPGQDPMDKQQAGLIYKLDWASRDEIITNLNRYTALCSGEKADAAGKAKLVYDNADLYEVLIDLPLKSNASVSIASGQPNKSVLDLNGITRSQIVNTLVANQSLVVDGDSASEENKSEMVKQNNELVVKLMSLPVSVHTVLEAQTDRLIKRSEVAGEMARLKKIFSEQTAKNLELTKTINELTSKNRELAKTVDEQAAKDSESSKMIQKQAANLNEAEKLADSLQRPKKAEDLREVLGQLIGQVDLGLNRRTVDFEFELSDVDALMLNGRCHSEYFFANQLAWRLKFGMNDVLGDKVLSVYLYAEDLTGRNGKYSVNATFEVTILHSSGGWNLSRKTSSDFGSTKTNYGWLGFVSSQSLREDGYVKQNKAKIRVHLELGELSKH